MDIPDEQPEPAAQPMEHRTARLWTSRGLVVLASVLLVVGVLAVWVKRTVLDTPTWTDTSSRVLQDPVVQQTLASYLTDQLYNNVDVAGQLERALPSQAKPLAGPAAAALRGAVQTAAVRTLQSPHVQNVWTAANRQANRQLINLLEGGGSRLQTSNGEIVLNLHPVIEQVAGRAGIADRVNGALPADAGRVVLLRSQQLKTAQDAAEALKVVADFVVIAVVLLFALAIWVAPDRRRGLRACAFGGLAAALVLILVRRVLGGALIDRLVTTDSIKPAAHHVWWIASEQIRLANVTLLFVSLVALVGVWVSGKGEHALSTRRTLAPYLREPAIAYGVLAAVILLLLIWSPTPAARTASTAITLIVLAVVGVELLRRQTGREFPDAERRPITLSLPRRAQAANGHAALPPPAPAMEDLQLSRLERLGELHTRGVLNDAEFAREKERLLTPRAAAGQVPTPS